MAVPGSNLLTSALTIICRDSFQYLRFNTITTNEIGLDVRDYDQPITRSGSVQSVDVSDIKNMGLDFTKSYIQVWTETPVNAVERDRSGDQIIWNGRRFEIQGETDWNAVDGWNSFTAVEVPTP